MPIPAIGPVAPHMTPVAPSIAPGTTGGAAAKPSSSSTSGFADLVGRFVGNANAEHAHSEIKVKELMSGESENVHDVVMSVAQADLSFRLLMEIRNRLIESYKELMQMQV